MKEPTRDETVWTATVSEIDLKTPNVADIASVT